MIDALAPIAVAGFKPAEAPVCSLTSRSSAWTGNEIRRAARGFEWFCTVTHGNTRHLNPTRGRRHPSPGGLGERERVRADVPFAKPD